MYWWKRWHPLPEGMTFDETNLQTLLQELTTDFTLRDQMVSLWDALVLRERDRHDGDLGTHIPAPFDKSPTVIKHATGIIADRSQFLTDKAAENTPNIVVNTLTETEGPPVERRLREARRIELGLNGIYWSANGRKRSLQQRTAWSAVTKGVGWYHSYRSSEGWNSPDRMFFHDPSDDLLEAMREDGVEVTDAFVGGPDDATIAEEPESLRRRRDRSRKQRAIDGETLYVVETLSPGKVYYREDTDGISFGVIIEEIPKTALGDEFGIVEENGAIIAGRMDGTTLDKRSSWRGTWTLARVWTRTEYYYFVSAGTGNSFAGNGRIVASGKHAHQEVPLWPVYVNDTDSAEPAYRYLPGIYGALAMIPGYNQVLTLLSNAAIFNTTPRYVIIKPDGTPVVDPETGDLVEFETDTAVGLDPQYVAIIEGGGQFFQLKIENLDHMIALMEMYSSVLDTTLPSEAALGSSGSSEPAWGTRLKQAAQNVKVAPIVDSHAEAVSSMATMWARDLRAADHKIYIKSAPGRRGQSNNVRGLIELDPKTIHTDIAVRQDKHDLQERLQLMQIGGELLASQRIDPITYYEEFHGSDDPLGAWKQAMGYTAFLEVMPVIIQDVAAQIRGEILGMETPNQLQAEAELAAGQLSAAPVGEPAEAGGVRFPGQEQGLTQNAAPPLQGGNGASPLDSRLPV